LIEIIVGTTVLTILKNEERMGGAVYGAAWKTTRKNRERRVGRNNASNFLTYNNLKI